MAYANKTRALQTQSPQTNRMFSQSRCANARYQVFQTQRRNQQYHCTVYMSNSIGKIAIGSPAPWGLGPPAEGPGAGACIVRATAAAVGPGAVCRARGGMASERGGVLNSINSQLLKDKENAEMR